MATSIRRMPIGFPSILSAVFSVCASHTFGFGFEWSEHFR